MSFRLLSQQRSLLLVIVEKLGKLEMWANAHVMAALLNICGAFCSMPQSLADAQYWSAVQ